jgi:uncharacterized protein (DUF2235 family)
MSEQPPTKPRNLVVCCDGSGNIWGNQADTNVVKLIRRCVKNDEQLVYYDPGVGTKDSFPAVGAFEQVKFRLGVITGLAQGRGVYENIAQAYEFLVHNYQEDDRIYLFGFSRGAFTARSVSGLVQMFGIVRPCAAQLLPLMLRSYFSDPDESGRQEFADDIKTNFTDEIGRDTYIHFIGVWDTVATVGGLNSQKIWSDRGLVDRRFHYVRHALAADEYRAKYEPRLYEGPQNDEPSKTPDGRHMPSLKERWFAGVHSDVGGSYAENESGLSNTALAWMLSEASKHGLDLLPAPAAPATKPRAVAKAHDQALVSPLWALTGLRRRKDVPARGALLSKPSAPAHGASLLKHAWLWWSTAATLIAWALASWLTPGDQGVIELWPVSIEALAHNAAALAQFQLDPTPMRLAYAHRVLLALLADCAFIAAYTCLLCTLTVHAVRSLQQFMPSTNGVHTALAWLTLWPLRLIILFDLAENALTLAYVQSTAASSALAAALTVSATAKLACGAPLLLIFAFAACRAVLIAATRKSSDRPSIEPAMT